MRRRLISAFLFVFCILTPLIAQEVTGSILGTVTDKTGAVVKDATVTVTNTDRNAVIRTLKTNEAGSYVAALLPIGHYSVSVAAPGFKTFTQTKITLNVADKVVINSTLNPGSVGEVVTVEANALRVDTASSAAAGLIDGTQIRELALSARNYEEMVALVPGVSSAVSDTIYVGVETPGRGTNEIDFSINGGRFSQNNWTIDGADNVDRGGNFSLLNYPSVDAIAEFKVLRSQYSPEYGRGAGGQIDIITRSGTSKFHGGVYEFVRNDIFNANYYLNKHFADPSQRIPRDELRYNDFGWTFGGPIYIPGHYNTERNKTFFFYSEEIRRVVTNTSVQSTAPTDSERHGIFDSNLIPDGLCTAYDAGGNCVANTGVPAPNTQVVLPGPFNPAANAYLTDVFSNIPFPQDPSTDTLTMNGKNIFNYRQEIIRIDHTFSPRLMVTGRWMNDSVPTTNPAGLFGFTTFLGYATTKTNSPGRNLLVRGTITITPTILDEVGYAWSSGGITSDPIGYSRTSTSPDVAAAINLPLTSPLPRIPNINFNTGLSGLSGFTPYRDFNKNYNWFDNLTWAIGRHTLKFGASYNRYQKNENDGGGNPSNGSFTFYDTDPAGNSSFQQEFANFLLGNVQNFTQQKADFAAKIRQHQFEAYAQDDYRFRPNLTLNFGLRYSYYGQPFDELNRNVSFLPSLYNPANAPTIDPTTGDISGGGSGTLIPGTSTPFNGVIIAKQNSPFGRAVADQTHNFAPRFGFSWDPFNKGKTAIRGGWGMFFDSPAVGFVENNTFFNPPFVGAISINNPVGPTAFTDPASFSPATSLGAVALKGVKSNWELPRTQMWSLDVQQELPFQTIIDVGYYGSTSRHLLGIVDINQPVPGAYLAAGVGQTCLTPPCPIDSGSAPALAAVRPYQGFGPINVSSPVFNANYHSLQTSLRKQFQGGSQVSLNYTWSKAMTNAPDDFYTPQNNRDLRAEWGLSSFDRRNQFNANFVYEFPWLKNQQGVTGHLLGGWQLSGILTFQSGLPLTVTGVNVDTAGLGLLDPFVNTDFSNIGSSNPGRPDQLGDPNHGAPQTADQWFNTSVFADPSTLGVPGNTRRTTVKGPGEERVDLALMKNIRIREGMGFQLRFESFNVFNHTNFQNIDTDFTDSGGFGTVTQVHEPRIMQFGFKFNF